MRLRRTVYALGVLALLGFVVWASFRYQASKADAQYDELTRQVAQWGYPVTLEELAERYAIPEGSVNGRESLVVAHDLIDWSGVNYDFLPIAGEYSSSPEPGTPYPPEVLDEMHRFLERNADPISEMRAAVHEPVYQMTIPFDAIPAWHLSGGNFDDPGKLRSAARVLSIQALYEIEARRIENAITFIETGLLMASQEMRQPEIISYLVGNAIGGISLWGIQPLLERGDLTQEQHRSLDEALRRVVDEQDFGYVLWTGHLIEDAFWRWVDSAWIQEIVSGPPPLTLGELGAQGLSAAYGVLNLGSIDRLRYAELLIDFLTQYHSESPHLEQDVRMRRFRGFGNGVAYQMSAAVNLKVSGASARWMTSVQGFRVLAAARMYADTHGAWPMNIDVLTPDYLDEIPRDPFDGDALRYRVLEQHVVAYAVGLNGLDDGGFDPVKAESSGDDVAVWVRKPALMD